MVKTVYLLVEGEGELSAYNTLEEALESCGSLIDFILADTTLLSISFDPETNQLKPTPVDQKDVARYYERKREGEA